MGLGKSLSTSFSLHLQHIEIPRPNIEKSCSCDLYHSCDNARSLIYSSTDRSLSYCATVGTPVCQFYLSFWRTSSFIDLLFVFCCCCYFSLYFIYLCSNLYYFLLSANFGLHFSAFSGSFRCKVRLFIWDFSFFFLFLTCDKWKFWGQWLNQSYCRDNVK